MNQIHPAFEQPALPAVGLGRYLRLGASLYMPATRPDLRSVLSGRKLPRLRSLVVCTEDAVLPSKLDQALANLRRVLPTLGERGPLRFVRPRDPDVLETILRMPNAHRLHGVCLPKFGCGNAAAYLDVLARSPRLWIMPIVETEAAFCQRTLARLRRQLDAVQPRVVCIRVGGNDLLQRLGIRRPAHLTAYETPLGAVIDQMIIAFRPHGYELSAPVFEHLDRPEILKCEVALDVTRGLLAKTAVHPTQVSTIETAYAVPADDAAFAAAVLDPQAAAVFRFRGQMAEPATHRQWALRTQARLAEYGSTPGALLEVAS